MALPRGALLALALGQVVLFGGSVYGWPALRTVLTRDAVLAELCEAEDCEARDLAFGLSFTFGSWSVQGGRLFIGVLLDHIGPRATTSLCMICVAGAYGVFLGVAGVPELCVAMALCGLGSGVQLAVQSVAELYPARRSAVLGLLSGAFQVSTSFWLVLKILHQHGATSQAMFSACSATAALAAVAALFIWPRVPFRSEGAKRASVARAEEMRDSASFWTQVSSPLYRDLVAWYSLLLVGAQLTIGSLNDQVHRKTSDPEQVDRLVTAFTISMGFSAIAAPLTGCAIDRFGFAVVAAAVSVGNGLSHVLLLSSSVSLQYVTFAVYAAARVSLYAFFFARIGGAFGFRFFGKLAGIGLFVSAMCSLLQYGLLYMSFALGGFDLANSLLAGVAVLALVYPYRLRRDELAARAQEAEPAEAKNDPHGEVAKQEGALAETSSTCSENTVSAEAKPAEPKPDQHYEVFSL